MKGRVKLFNCIPPSAFNLTLNKKPFATVKFQTQLKCDFFPSPVPNLLVSLLLHILGQCLQYQRVGQKLGQAYTSSPGH